MGLGKSQHSDEVVLDALQKTRKLSKQGWPDDIPLFMSRFLTKIFLFAVFRYVPAAVEISRTASSSGNSNFVANEHHHNHASKSHPDNINSAHVFGMAPNNANQPINANIGFHDLVEPPCLGGAGMNGKPTQRTHLAKHHQNSYMS